MNVEFWGVGALESVLLAMTTENISGHLLTDWIPSLPLAVSSSFIGWPSFLIDTVSIDSNEFLTLSPITTGSERQWKSVLSWMLGVAGARHVLANDGYRWIAPLSAFYDNSAQPVAVQATFPFPASSIEVSSDPDNPSNLRPDYLAVRPRASTNGDMYDWALAEAKGTSSLLATMEAVPETWSNQVRNAIVRVNGVEVASPRHLVICTRVNPNAVRPRTRRIQLRSWNRKDLKAMPLSPEAVADVAAAHLFGLFKGLHMPENAAAVAASVEVRARTRGREGTVHEPRTTTQLLGDAQEELRRRQSTEAPLAEDKSYDTWIALTIPEGAVDVALASPLIALSRELIEAETDAEAAAALQRADTALDIWETSRRTSAISTPLAVLNGGVAISLRRRR